MGWNSKTKDQLIEEVESEILEIQASIDETYQKVKDFTVDYETTRKAELHIKSLNGKKKAAERRLKNLRQYG
jgi:hypothetical protein